MPQPPYGQGIAAAQAAAQAMTDVSDGLLADLGHIATASNVTIDLSGAALQADVDAVQDEPPRPVPIRGRWCWPAARTMLWRRLPGPVPDGWRVIGAVREGPPGVVVDGRQWTGPAGWQSFD